MKYVWVLICWKIDDKSQQWIGGVYSSQEAARRDQLHVTNAEVETRISCEPVLN